MIFGTEEPALFPVKDLYDTGMILSYINSVQREYERGLAEEKEFAKEHRSFISPSDVDTKRYYDLTVGRMQKLFDFANKNGIDLYRSPQGQSLIRLFIRDTDHAELAKLKKSSEKLQKYDDLLREMQAKGIDVLNPKNTRTYNTSANGIFNETPLQFKNIIEYWKPSLDAIKDKDHIIDDGKGHVYHQLGVTEDDVRAVVDANWNTYVNSAYGKNHMDDTKAKLLLQYPTLANDSEKLNFMAESQLKDAIVKQGVRSKSPEADPYSLVKFKTDESIREEYSTSKYKRTSGGGSGNGSSYSGDDIFDEADKNNGTPVDYVVDDSNAHKISLEGNVGSLRRDEKNDTEPYYSISGIDIAKCIRESNGKPFNKTVGIDGYRLYPYGSIESHKQSDGSYKRYITGALYNASGTYIGRVKYPVNKRGSAYRDQTVGVHGKVTTKK